MKSAEEYSSQDISLMEFREKLFLEEMERYTTAITGERESILPFVRNESGHYSEEKTWALIRELTRCAHIYWEYYKEQLHREERAEGSSEDFIELAYSAADSFSPRRRTIWRRKSTAARGTTAGVSHRTILPNAQHKHRKTFMPETTGNFARKRGETPMNSQPLTLKEAAQIREAIRSHTDTSDPDIAGLYQTFYQRAVKYAHIRAGWNLLTREQKQDTDSSRTHAHDAFINSVQILARLQGEAGAAWKEALGEDRKRIGDFACYLALFQGLEAR